MWCLGKNNAHPYDLSPFFIFLMPRNNIPYTAVTIEGDPRTAIEHILTMTDVRTKSVISLSGESDIEVVVYVIS